MSLPLFHFPILESSQDTSFQMLESGAPPPFMISCDQQTKGRGRLSRPWHSEAGRSLTFSLAVQLACKKNFSGLSLVVGLAIAEYLDGVAIQLKWPNDLLIDGHKVGGILIESRSQGENALLVIGVGLNLFSFQYATYRSLQRAVDLEELGSTIYNALKIFESEGFSPFLVRYQARLWKKDQKVWLKLGEEDLEGVIRGVSELGALQLESEQKIKLLENGELELES